MTDAITYQDVLIPGSTYEIGLTRLTGLKVVEVMGYLTREFGEVTFKITELVMENGSYIDVEGEHDFPYLAVYSLYPVPNMDDKTLERLYNEEHTDYDQPIS